MTTQTRPWRLVLRTSGAPIYDSYRSKKAAREEADYQSGRADQDDSRVREILIQKWDAASGRWELHEKVWPQPRGETPLPS